MANNPALGIRGVPSGSAASGNSVEIQFSNVPFARGSQDVHEAFGEVLVPLLADVPFVKQLNFSGAYRWAEYSGAGGTESWKTGLDWSVFEDLRLRGTISQDVRAATIGEKYDRTGGVGYITDYLIDPDGAANSKYFITTFSNGSPDLKPEKARTQTAGVVYIPGWLSGLQISADWYSVNVKDNINKTTAPAVVSGCYLDGDVDLCRLITREGPERTTVNGETVNTISLVGVPYYNQASVKAKGIDFEIAYNRSVDWLGGGETVGLRLLGSYLGERSNTDSAGNTTEVQRNMSYPEWTAVLSGIYHRGPLGLFLTARYTDERIIFLNWNHLGKSTKWNVFDNTLDATTLVDARVNYRFDFDNWNMNLFVNVNNVFDKAPQRVLSVASIGWMSAFNYTDKGVTGDLLGRRFVLGVNFEF
jgi:outer membrane receptor protein involved in Fe transport